MRNCLTLIFIFISNVTFSQIIGRVINVIDGDSFTILDTNNKSIFEYQNIKSEPHEIKVKT